MAAAVLADIVRMMTTADYQSDKHEDESIGSTPISSQEDQAAKAEKDWVNDLSANGRPMDDEIVRLMSMTDCTGELYIDTDPTEFGDQILEDLFEEDDRKAAEKGKRPHNFMTYYGEEHLRKEMKVRINCKYWPWDTKVPFPPHMSKFKKTTLARVMKEDAEGKVAEAEVE